MSLSTIPRRHAAGLWLLCPLALAACGGPPTRSRAAVAEPLPPPSAAATLTLGDVDPDTPARRSERLQPLADYLARGLTEFGIERGRVKIARDLEQMAGYLRDGSVDLYLDSVYPTLAVRDLAGTRVLLRRWVLDVGEYASLIVTAADDVRSLADLRGRIVAFQEDYSTSGFLLPASLLLDRGFALRPVSGPRVPIAASEIGYVFSHDEENTIEMVVNGTAAAGAIHDQEFDSLPPDLQAQLRILDRSPTVPRQLLSARPGLEPDLVATVETLLLALRDADGNAIAIGDSPAAWSWKFDRLPPEIAAELDKVSAMIERVKGSAAP